MRSSMEARQLISRGWVLLVVLSSGCVTTHPWLTSSEHHGANTVSEVNAIWEGHIRVTQDTVNGGRPLPGLAGRLYLFGPDLGHTKKGNGTVTVDLFDTSNPQPGVRPRHLERWEFDQVSLGRLLKKDKIGWGYTLFLPWPAYRPDITHVRLNAFYTPANGAPVYGEPASIALQNQANLTQTRQVGAKSAPGS
jgi:hypothetical protein